MSQAEAEDAFLLADTSGDGLVDEDELLVLLQQLSRKRMLIVADEVLLGYVRTFRKEASTPLNLDFDDFVDVYNKFVHAQASGKLVRMQTEANLGAA